MSVNTYNPNNETINENPVKFSQSAIKHLSKQVINNKAKGIEFKVKESGCSGYKYLLELAQEISNEVTIYRLSDSLNLFLAPKTIPFIKGTLVDYIQEGVNFHLTFTNPNATASCGCGESFSVEKQN